MKIDATPPSDVVRALKTIFDALNKRLTLGENLQSAQLTVTDSGSADTEFTVTHGLGRIPRHYLYNTNKNGVVYDSRRSDWTNKEMFLKCSSANTQIILTVL